MAGNHQKDVHQWIQCQRGGDISIIFRPGWKGGSEQGATHGLWYPFDSHLPLVWMGWNVPHGYTNRRVEMTDIAPTIAAMLKVQMPSGSIGHPILKITDKNKKEQPSLKPIKKPL